MKTKLAAPILVTVICLLLVVGATSHAQSLDDHQPIHQSTISNTVYLPFVSKPPCAPKGTAAYVATSKPVVRAGEIMTVTGALVNECNPLVGMPLFSVHVEPSGILSPSFTMRYGFPPSIPIGGYEEVTFTLQAVGSGVVTVTTGATYETTADCNPPGFCYNGVESSPTIVRVLP